MPNFIVSKFVFFTLLCKPGPPSAPRNAISNVDKLVSFWNGFLLLATGGRKRCHIILHARSATPMQVCVTSVAVMSGTSQQIGLKNTSVMVVDLLAHTNYLWDWGSEWSVRLEPRSPAVCVCKCNHKSSR